MGPMILRQEVLPPRQAPRARDFVTEDQALASIRRSIWTCVGIVGLSQVLMRMLETF